MHDKKIKRILFSAEQAGGVDVLESVIKKIKKNKNIEYFLVVFSENIFKYAKKKGVKNLRMINLSSVVGFLEKYNPDIIFTDTNDTEFDNSIDKKIIKASKYLGKPSVAFIDAWINYKKRFNFKYLPDYILVVDVEMKNDLKKIGIPEGKIRIVGSPRFDKLGGVKMGKEIKNTVVFYSDNEVNIFEDIAELISAEFPNKKIIIKFHPSREKNTDKYDSIIEKCKIKIKKAGKNEDSYNLNQKAELIIGTKSIALFDAALIGKKVLSYQPGKNISNDTLRSNIYGWSVPVYDKKDLSRIMKKMLSEKIGKGKKHRKEYTESKSTEKIIALIKLILKTIDKK